MISVKTSVKPVIRKMCIATALAGVALTAASIVKTPGKTLNQNDTWQNQFLEPEKVARTFKYDDKKSILDNTSQAATVTKNNLYDKVIDPVTEKPTIPLTLTALSLLGIAATRKQGEKGAVEDK